MRNRLRCSQAGRKQAAKCKEFNSDEWRSLYSRVSFRIYPTKIHSRRNREGRLPLNSNSIFGTGWHTDLTDRTDLNGFFQFKSVQSVQSVCHYRHVGNCSPLKEILPVSFENQQAGSGGGSGTGEKGAQYLPVDAYRSWEGSWIKPGKRRVGGKRKCLKK